MNFILMLLHIWFSGPNITSKLIVIILFWVVDASNIIVLYFYPSYPLFYVGQYTKNITAAPHCVYTSSSIFRNFHSPLPHAFRLHHIVSPYTLEVIWANKRPKKIHTVLFKYRWILNNKRNQREKNFPPKINWKENKKNNSHLYINDIFFLHMVLAKSLLLLQFHILGSCSALFHAFFFSLSVRTFFIRPLLS